LRQPIRQHGARGGDVDDVCAAILFPEPVVRRARIEKKYPTPASGIGGFQQLIGGEIGDHHRHAQTGQRSNRCRGIVFGLDLHVFERKGLVEKTPGGVVVVNSELSAGQSIVLGRLLDQRDRNFLLGSAQIADLNLRRVLRERPADAEARKGDDHAAEAPPFQRLPLFIKACAQDDGRWSAPSQGP